MTGRGTAFDLYHPAVPACYFAAALVLGMAAFQPVLLGISLAAALACSICLRGWRAAGKSLLWQVPLLLIVTVANPLFSASGSTELFRIGLRAVYSESLAYGACMGAMLVGTVLWFSNASHVLTSDKVMALLGNAVPTVALMLSMAARLVPQFVRRGTEIASVQRACAAARPSGAKAQAAARIRMLSVLMGWSMEDSLDTADAMRARGWGATRRRTAYRRCRFRLRDGAALALVLAWAALCAFLAWTACSQFTFYPQLSTLVPWWGYVPYALFLLLPVLLQAGEALRWSR